MEKPNNAKATYYLENETYVKYMPFPPNCRLGFHFFESQKSMYFLGKKPKKQQPGSNSPFVNIVLPFEKLQTIFATHSSKRIRQTTKTKALDLMKAVTGLQAPVVVCSVVHVHRPRGCGSRTWDKEWPREGKKKGR